MVEYLDVDGLGVKLDHDRSGIVITHKEAIYTWMLKARVYDSITDTGIFVGAWLQCLFVLLRVDDVNSAPPDDKF